MKLKVRFTLFTLIFLFLTALPSITAQDSEHLTITTYYPSPVGSYNEMTVASRQAIGDVNGDGQYNTGDMAVDTSFPPNPINGTLTVKNRLGIGTRTPKEKLEVAGRVYQSGLGSSTFFGFEAGKNDDLTDNYNTAFGYQAFSFNTAGVGNTAIGYQALFNNIASTYNTAVGYQALRANNGGANNTAIGEGALYANTTGANNTAIGATALLANTTGLSNTAIGVSALLANTTGFSNTAIGVGALAANTIADNNTAIGRQALILNTIGIYNTAIGSSALSNNTTGNQNTAIGVSALQNNTSGFLNNAIGFAALLANTTGARNAAIGVSALQNNTTGSQNIAIGEYALQDNTTGSYNIAIGPSAGNDLTTGTNSVYLGSSARALNNNDTNSIVIGANAVGIGTNSVVLGNDSIATTALKGNVGIGTENPGIYKLYVNGQVYASGGYSPVPSDLRFKKNVKKISGVLEKIKNINAVSFNWRSNEFPERVFSKERQIGIVAQEVEKEFPELVQTDPEGYKTFAYDKFTAVLLEAIKEQQKEIDELREEIVLLKTKVSARQ